MTTSIILIVLGIIYIIYSVINKEKIFINNKDNYIILDKIKFQKLQLFTNILSSVILIGFGVFKLIYEFNDYYILISAFIYILLNSLIAPIALKKNIIKKKRA